MSHFPMFRLVTLLARQLSTPIANYIRVYTRRHPRYSRSLCMGVGRAFQSAELRFRMWTLGLKQPRQLPPISDQNALDSGAFILGEVVLFGMGGLILVLEVNRQANKQEDKVLDEESQWLSLLVSLEELQRELVLQQLDLDRLQAALGALAAPPAPTPSPAPESPPPKAPTTPGSGESPSPAGQAPVPPPADQAPAPPPAGQAPPPADEFLVEAEKSYMDLSLDDESALSMDYGPLNPVDVEPWLIYVLLL